METWEIITTRWYNGDIDREGEPLFRFARNDILDLRDTIKAQQVEIETLKGLLQQWESQSKYLKDCFEGYKRWESEALIRLKQDTNEVLK